MSTAASVDSCNGTTGGILSSFGVRVDMVGIADGAATGCGVLGTREGIVCGIIPPAIGGTGWGTPTGGGTGDGRQPQMQ